MKRMVLAGAVLGVVGAGPAFAADLARAPAPVTKAPAVVAAPVFSWTGFYIGANAGYGWGSGQDAADYYGLDPKGWSAGGQAGFNYQFDNNIVAGIETDFQGGDISDSVGGISSKMDWFGTLRGRLGYAAGRFLPYVTGGLAYGSNSIDNLGWSQSKTLVGWTAGAGIEYALTDHWTAKTEYLYTDFGSKAYDNIGTFGTDAGLTTQTARIGVNYKF